MTLESEPRTYEFPDLEGRLRIGMIHPDLGIGGAERLVVDAALGLQKLGHSVEIITSHHDPAHSFEETNNGLLQVTEIPSIIPRSIFGALHIYLAVLRQLQLLAVLLFLIYTKRKEPHDVYIVDQLSACVPFLRWATGKRVVFYVHFPDKLLAGGKEADVHNMKKNMSLVKWLYRGPADWIEEKSTAAADILLANSKFTANVFDIAFPAIQQRPRVVYPGINIDAFDAPFADNGDDVRAIESVRPTLISLNRYEGKKNVALAIEAFALLKQSSEVDPKLLSNIRLVIGGGYDPRVRDNVSTLQSLAEACKRHTLSYKLILNGTSPAPDLPDTTASVEAVDIIFILNFTTAQRSYLLRSSNTLCLLYTPGHEHFGIGPVEGMVCGLPVIACTSGGPTESLVDYAEQTAAGSSGTAWLRDPVPKQWAAALKQVVSLAPDERHALGELARNRAVENFSMEKMAQGFEDALIQAVDMGPVTKRPIPFVTFQGMRLATAFAVVVTWMKLNGYDLMGGPVALLTLFVVCVAFLTS